MRTSAKGEEPDGMTHYAAFHQDLHCLLRQSQSSEKEYSKSCLKRPLKRRSKVGFQDRLSLNTGQKYCRILQGEHSAILLTFIKLPFAIKTFVLSIFERPRKTGFTVTILFGHYNL